MKPNKYSTFVFHIYLRLVSLTDVYLSMLKIWNAYSENATYINTIYVTSLCNYHFIDNIIGLNGQPEVNIQMQSKSEVADTQGGCLCMRDVRQG